MANSCAEQIDQLYKVFGSVRKPRLTPASPQGYDEVAIGRIPLDEVPGAWINDFVFELGTTVGDAEDVRYFLPRICELFAEGTLSIDFDMLLHKVGRDGGWSRWTPTEQASFRDFTLAFQRQPNRMADVQIVWSCAELFGDVTDWLDQIRAGGGPDAVCATRWLAEEEARFFEKHGRPKSPQISEWLNDPQTLAHVEQLRSVILPDRMNWTEFCDETIYWLHRAKGASPM